LFSKCKSYRWILTRDLEKGKKSIVFIGLNPSTGDSEHNDRTLTRMIHFCTQWDYKYLYVINLFGLISKSPSELNKSKDPVGKYNHLITSEILKFWNKNDNCDLWLGWGDKGTLNRRDLTVLKMIKNFSNLNFSKSNPSKRLFSLGLTKKGNPRHPLYMPSKTFLRQFEKQFLCLDS